MLQNNALQSGYGHIGLKREAEAEVLADDEALKDIEQKAAKRLSGKKGWRDG